MPGDVHIKNGCCRNHGTGAAPQPWNRRRRNLFNFKKIIGAFEDKLPKNSAQSRTCPSKRAARVILEKAESKPPGAANRRRPIRDEQVS